ncbi:MAG: hypothetical protein ACYCV4_05515 [Dermatophilaceae bacterium]
MRFRKKPVVIEAMRLGADNIEAVADWVMSGLVSAKRFEEDVSATLRGPDAHLDINTLEGVMRAEIGDYVIRGVKGEHYPCKPDIFDATYEPVQ